ncbi:MAG: STAS domain-containing protein [Dehalococcoidales bacterium]|nr:STAS domain-containing protein [Dehalococcoidales bacterium]
MEVSERTAGGVKVIALGGRLDAYAANDIERKLDSLVASEKVRLVVDLGQLDYISSSGLRVLLGALKKAREQQGDIVLSGLQPYVKEIFEISGFTQLFKMFDKTEEAIISYQQEK